MTEKLTDKVVRSLPAPSKGNKITYDNEVRGFGVRVTAKGVHSFILNYRIHGRERRFTIGSYPEWSVSAARAEAKDLRRQIDRGIDPLAVRTEAREASTVEELWKRYEKEHLPTKAERAQADDRSMFQKYILPELGSATRLHEIQFSDIDRLHKKISQKYPVRANRVLEVLRKAFNLASQWGWHDENPCIGVKRNVETRRSRYLSNEERLQLLLALNHHSEIISANAIKFMLLTGARKGEVFNASWNQFDLDTAVWVKPASHTKQRREHRVVLSSAAVKMLKKIKETTEGSFAFPGKSPDDPLQDVKRTWQSVCKEASIENCRLHDLRHSFAAVLVSNGASLPIVGAMLGHSQPNTTARYAHLMDEPLRHAVEMAAEVILSDFENNDEA